MKTSMQVKLMVGILCLVMVVAAGGCKTKKQAPIAPTTSTPPAATSGSGQPKVDLDSLLWNEATGLQKVYFDYDKFALRADAIKTLDENAGKIKEALKAEAKTMIQIEGHCDERGTQEYNLALGEKRALAVRDYLIKVGISGDNLVTISYGKERPVAQGHDEAAWKQNRRAAFNKAVAK